MRSALVEGASWWARAFEAAGFKDAFKVEVLPDDADPMDLRYNVIQWVHRSTRGWSYGSSVIDPRTGEILKGRVTLDSLRARQDALIGTGLVDRRAAPGRLRRGEPARGRSTSPALDPSAEPAAMVLARIRQLSAHEVGHTLGLAHNFAASTYGRASVMDYPAPLVKIRDGKTLDLSDAYAKGIGAYDLLAVRYAYAQFPPGADEAKELGEIVRKGVADGLLFLSDADARPAGAAPPAGQSLGQRRRPGRLASPRDGGAGDRPRTVRPRAASPTGRRCRTSKPGSCRSISTTATSSRRPSRRWAGCGTPTP